MINQIKQKINAILITSCISGLVICSMTVNAQETQPEQSPTAIEVKTDTDLSNQPLINDEANFVGPVQVTEKIYHKTTFSLLGEPKYPEDFDHLDYVNPKAPKGGTIKLAEIGTFDNFNRYASRGAPEKNSGSLYDTLFTNLADDITSFYPLIATSVDRKSVV